jgi:ankyrin repeat protein
MRCQHCRCMVGLLNALHRSDAAGNKRLATTGAPADAVGAFGPSALMYAALYSDAATVGLLLDRAANPNHADHAGANALISRVLDAVSVRFPIRRGGKINAVSNAYRPNRIAHSRRRPGKPLPVKGSASRRNPEARC